MSDLRTGDIVLIPFDIRQGAFPDEYLITLDTAQGPISGFVPRDQVTNIHGDKGSIRGRVEEVGEDVVTVMVRGSFFTTTGLAYLQIDWAKHNLQPMNQGIASN